MAKKLFAFEVRFPPTSHSKSAVQGVTFAYTSSDVSSHLHRSYPDCSEFTYIEVPDEGVTFPLFSS